MKQAGSDIGFDSIDALWECSPSAQQLRIVVGLARGKSYSEIANEMHVVTATIDYHIDRLKRQTGQKSAAGIVAAAFVGGWLSVVHWPVVPMSPQDSAKAD